MERMTAKQFNKEYKTFFKTKSNKHNNRKCTYNGTVYQSGGEAKFAQDLDLQVKAGLIKRYDKQVRTEIRLNGELITKYKIDFIIYHLDGLEEHIEYKGFFDSYSKLRWKLYKAHYKNVKGVKCTFVKHKEDYNYFEKVLTKNK